MVRIPTKAVTTQFAAGRRRRERNRSVRIADEAGFGGGLRHDGRGIFRTLAVEFALWSLALDDWTPGWRGRAYDLARATFGLRSFHAAANPTQGDLVTTGPYRFLRHPIYASIFLFVWAGVLAHLSVLSFSLGALATAGAVERMICEEHLLLRRYPVYREYMRRTKRLLPGLW